MKKKIFLYKHIIFFSEESIKRIISSKHILIDATFCYPIDFQETKIIMFYDSLLNIMIQRILIIINNKKFECYKQIFLYIKNYIYNIIKKDFNKINWETFTTYF